MSVVIFYLSMCTLSVRADGGVAENNPFTTKGQSHLPGVTVAPFKVGDQQISVHVGSYEYVYGSMTSEKGNKMKKPADKNYEVPCSQLELQENSQCQGRKWTVSGYRAGGDGNYTVELEKSLEEGDEITLTFADDGNLYFGKLVFEDEKTKNNRLQKERETEEQIQHAQRQIEEERKYVEQKSLEDAMLKKIRENNHKTWYQRLGDSIQDQWWNFNSWWKG